MGGSNQTPNIFQRHPIIANQISSVQDDIQEVWGTDIVDHTLRVLLTPIIKLKTNALDTYRFYEYYLEKISETKIQVHAIGKDDSKSPQILDLVCQANTYRILLKQVGLEKANQIVRGVIMCLRTYLECEKRWKYSSKESGIYLMGESGDTFENVEVILQCCKELSLELLSEISAFASKSKSENLSLLKWITGHL